MIRSIFWVSVFGVLVAAPTNYLQAQVKGYSAKSTSYSPHFDATADPRVRRANRERAVAVVGPCAREFVEALGDDAVAALFACSKPVAVKLAKFHDSGELGKLSKPRDLLYVIAQPRHGDDVALWAIQHAGELNDLDCFDAFLLNPLEYALNLKQLAAGANEVRASRLTAAAAMSSWQPPMEPRQGIALGIGMVIVALPLAWMCLRSLRKALR